MEIEFDIFKIKTILNNPAFIVIIHTFLSKDICNNSIRKY
jgi:hypothetical protein